MTVKLKRNLHTVNIFPFFYILYMTTATDQNKHDKNNIIG